MNSEKWDIQNFYRGIKGPDEFLCPVGVETLEIVGEFNSPQFKYQEIIVKGCQLETGCADDATIADSGLNFVVI